MKLFPNPDKQAKSTKLHVYLAGPDVFKPNAEQVGIDKKKAVDNAGHIGHFPLDNEIDEFKSDPDTGYRISAANEEMMDQCQVILVNMTPHHGPSMDCGSALEAGYMKAKAKYSGQNILIIGYTEGDYNNNFKERVAEMYYKGKIHECDTGEFRGDDDNMLLEDFGLSENLMIPGAIQETGGAIFSSFAEAVANITPLWQAKLAKAEQAQAEQAPACTV